MLQINYIAGDATSPIGEGAKILCHVCNDVGGWGKGFVVAISKRWKQPEMEYRKWYEAGEKSGFKLGAVQFVQVNKELWIANMIGQHKIVRTQSGPPIRYDAIASCLVQVAIKAQELNASVHMPRIGCGLAGGEWSMIEPLIRQYLVANRIAVTVYDFA